MAAGAAPTPCPGLNHVRFLDNKTGFVVGDGTDQFPTGVFITADSGRTWKPVPGPRCPGWLAADFPGRPDRRPGRRLEPAGDAAPGRARARPTWTRSAAGACAACKSVGKHGRGRRPGRPGADQRRHRRRTAGATPTLQLPTDVRAGLGFPCRPLPSASISGSSAGPARPCCTAPTRAELGGAARPASRLPLNGVFFIDERHGWAVGEFGSILATTDGGKTWKVQHRGGQRAAVLFVHARSAGLPLDTVALLGGAGRLPGGRACVVNAPDPDVGRARTAPARHALRGRRPPAGGAAGEMLWQFPVAQHLARAGSATCVKAWDRLHADRAAEELLRQLVLALRIWRPDVVITDHPDAKVTGSPAEALVAEAVREAFARAADPKAFPEQIQNWAWSLEGRQAVRPLGHRARPRSSLDLNEPSARLERRSRDSPPRPPACWPTRRWSCRPSAIYRLLDSRLEGAANHRDLMQGITLAPRRRRPPRHGSRSTSRTPKYLKAHPARAATCRPLAETGAERASPIPASCWPRSGPPCRTLPDDQGAAAAFALANQYARLGQWTLAREVFLLMVDRYPAHPLTADAYRWLIRYNSSSEARRRQELGQFLLLTQTGFATLPRSRTPLTRVPADSQPKISVRGKVQEVQRAATGASEQPGARPGSGTRAAWTSATAWPLRAAVRHRPVDPVLPAGGPAQPGRFRGGPAVVHPASRRARRRPLARRGRRRAVARPTAAARRPSRSLCAGRSPPGRSSTAIRRRLLAGPQADRAAATPSARRPRSIRPKPGWPTTRNSCTWRCAAATPPGATCRR